ncbi:MAG: cupin domain-containing protein [Streptosporangiales bacterium]|nr:cupin domain-containing protein [Streptosporangiales bacterium]
MPPVGERIREERLRRGMTLRGLARAVGVSASLVSQVETGKSRPSVSTLYAITQVLGISVEDVFDAGETAVPEPAAMTAQAMARAVQAAAVPDVGPDVGPAGGAERRVGPLVRPERREVLELDSGVTWERLGRVPGSRVDFLLVTYAPGGCSSSAGGLMRHSGVEYGYLIEGELTLTLGFDEYRLVPGDAVSFASTTPHRYRNDGEHPAAGVWFVHEPDT